MEHPDMIEETPLAAPRRGRGRPRRGDAPAAPKPPKDPSAAPRRPLLGPQRQRGIPKLLAALPALAVARDKDVIAVAAFLREYLTYHQHPKTVAKRDKRTAMIREHVKVKCTTHSAKVQDHPCTLYQSTSARAHPLIEFHPAHIPPEPAP